MATAPRDETIARRLQQALTEIDALVQSLESAPDPVLRDQALRLLQLIDLLHRVGIGRLVQHFHRAAPQAFQETLADPAVSLLLELYELDEAGQRARVNRILAEVQPYIASHGGELRVLSVQNGVVRIQLGGACSGCPAVGQTLRQVVETALREGMPEFERLEVELVSPAPRPAPPGRRRVSVPVQDAGRPGLEWETVASLETVPEVGILRIDTRGLSVLLVRRGDDIYAYRNACPGTPLPLSMGHDISWEEGIITCPWHGCRFDLHSGRRLDRAGRSLEVVPVAVQDGQIIIGRPRRVVHT
ncbi:Fe/S biogenesis protein NfuA [bacterium HR28]|nr:Fe/S biogenesis protein NfuA [bacterium HR28]